MEVKTSEKQPPFRRFKGALESTETQQYTDEKQRSQPPAKFFSIKSVSVQTLTFPQTVYYIRHIAIDAHVRIISPFASKQGNRNPTSFRKSHARSARSHDAQTIQLNASPVHCFRSSLRSTQVILIMYYNICRIQPQSKAKRLVNSNATTETSKL